MSSNGLLPSFLGALQASLSVLLVIFYGVIAAQFKLLDGPTAKTISKVCVRMFLPALLITNLGSELIPARGLNYAVVLGNHSLAYFRVVANIDSICYCLLQFVPWARGHADQGSRVAEVVHTGCCFQQNLFPTLYYSSNLSTQREFSPVS
jgi:hypothetical protein